MLVARKMVLVSGLSAAASWLSDLVAFAVLRSGLIGFFDRRVVALFDVSGCCCSAAAAVAGYAPRSSRCKNDASAKRNATQRNSKQYPKTSNAAKNNHVPTIRHLRRRRAGRWRWRGRRRAFRGSLVGAAELRPLRAADGPRSPPAEAAAAGRGWRR